MLLTVFYEGQYWVGVLESADQGKIRAARYIFGPEPCDADVLAFVNTGMIACIDAAVADVPGKLRIRRVNPKRLARVAAREMKRVGPSTFAQEALQKDYEARKTERRIVSRQCREAMAERKRTIKIQKAKEKKRGR